VKLKIVREPSPEGGFTVFVPSLPGCISEGNTRDEAVTNIKKAKTLYLEPTEDERIFQGNLSRSQPCGIFSATLTDNNANKLVFYI
jgi:predicted RNase H-like HicB family nuclease